jgi:hypothetical protein
MRQSLVSIGFRELAFSCIARNYPSPREREESGDDGPLMGADRQWNKDEWTA